MLVVSISEGVVERPVHVSIISMLMMEGIIIVIVTIILHHLHPLLMHANLRPRPPHPHEIHRRHVVSASHPPDPVLEEPRRRRRRYIPIHQHPSVHRHVTHGTPTSTSAVEEVRHLLRALMHELVERRRLQLIHLEAMIVAAMAGPDPGIGPRHGGDEILLHHGRIGGRGPHLGRLLEQGGGRHLGRAQVLVIILMMVVKAGGAGGGAELEAGGGGGHAPGAPKEVPGRGGEHSRSCGHVHGLERDRKEFLR